MARRRRQTPARAPAPSRRVPTAAAAAATAAEREQARRIEIDIANQAELRVNARNILSAIQMARPANTIKEYKPKQVEFTQFCERKQY